MLATRSLVPAVVRVAVVLFALSVACLAARGASSEDDAKWETRFRNLDDIHAALMLFREENGEYPLWLSDLVPRYLADASDLIDPFDERNGRPDDRRGQQPLDPNLPISYFYLLAPSTVDGDRSDRQGAGREIVGSGAYASIVRTMSHQSLGYIYLSVSGHIHLASGDSATQLKSVLAEDQTGRGPAGLRMLRGGRLPMPPARIARDVDAMVADFEATEGDTAGRYHAEGVLRAWNRDLDGAMRAMREASRRAPANVPIAYAFADLLYGENQPYKAAAQYETVLASGQSGSFLWNQSADQLATLYVQTQQPAKLDALLLAMERRITKDNHNLQRRLLGLYVRAGKHDRVVEKAEEFLGFRENSNPFYRGMFLGHIESAHRSLGNTERAEHYHRLQHPVYDLIGKTAPAFVLTDTAGSAYSSAALAGAPILLALWGAGLPRANPARVAALERMHQAYASDGLVVLAAHGIDRYQFDPPRVLSRGTFPILSDGAAAYNAFQVNMAATVLIDRRGYVRFVTTEPHEKADELEDAIRAALAEEADAPAPGVRVAGHARDSGGEPIADADVALYRWASPDGPYEEVARTHSDSDGSFDLGSHAVTAGDGAPLMHALQLVGIVPGAGLTLATLGPEVGAPDSIELTFGGAVTATGAVTDEGGEPIAGAEVFVRSVGGLDGGSDGEGPVFATWDAVPPLSAITAADGTYAIDGLPAGAPILLAARHPNYARVEQIIDLSEPSAIVLPHAGTLTGRVKYARRHNPASGESFAFNVEVVATTARPYGKPARAAYGFTGRATIDGEGRYRIEGVPPGRFNIWATTTDGWTCGARADFKVVAGEEHNVDLFLVEGGLINGRFIDDGTGEPVYPGEGSRVSLQGPSRPISVDLRDAHMAAVEKDGTFTFRAAPGPNFPMAHPTAPWTNVGKGDPLFENFVIVRDGANVDVVFRVRRQDATAEK
jgi:protocatechuate 3,4-dioxygenase beta subunit